MIRSIPAGRITGVPLRIGFSWLAVVPLGGWGLFLGTATDSGSLPTRILVASGGTVLLFLSVIVHELGHVVMARRRGVAVGGVSVFLLGGYSEMDLDDVPPSVEIAIAVSGSLASVFLAVVLGSVAVVLPDVGGLARVASVLMLVNAAIAAFNLLPGLPLDGGHVVRGMLRSIGWSGQRAERVAALFGIGIGATLTALGLAASWSGRPVSLMIAPAGMLLLLLCLTTRPPPERRARDVMRPVGDPVTEREPVRALETNGEPVPVVIGTRVVGLVWPGSSGLASEAMRPVGPADIVTANTHLSEIRTRLAFGPRVLLVVDKGKLVGVITPDELGAGS